MKKLKPLIRHSFHLTRTLSSLKVQLTGELLNRLRKYANSKEGVIRLLGNVEGFPRSGGWWEFYGHPAAEGRDLKEYCMKRLYRFLCAINEEKVAKEIEAAKEVAGKILHCTASAVHRYILRAVPSEHRKKQLVRVDREAQAALALAARMIPKPAVAQHRLQQLCQQFAH